MSQNPSRKRSASVGLGGTLLFQTGGTALLLAPFSLGWTTTGIALLCNLGGWAVLWSVLYFMAKQK